jgi:hypothetical protein
LKTVDPVDEQIGPLNLVLTHHWYDETEAGRKLVEYRKMIPRWTTQIWKRRNQIREVRFLRGFSSRSLTRKVLKIDIGPCPIEGWTDTYYRIHFEPELSHGNA